MPVFQLDGKAKSSGYEKAAKLNTSENDLKDVIWRVAYHLPSRLRLLTVEFAIWEGQPILHEDLCVKENVYASNIFSAVSLFGVN